MKWLFSGKLRQLTTVALVTIATISQAQTFDIGALRAQADAGDTQAQIILGEALIFGNDGIARDPAAGQDYLENAVASGDVAAKASLGKLLLYGNFVQQDPDRGVALLQEAAAAGNTEALTSLGGARLWGAVMDKDPAQARALLEQAVANGGIEAMYVLGEARIAGVIAPKDVQSGLQLMQQAAVSGDPQAKIALGKLLLYGQDVPRDITRAQTLFEEAAKAGAGEGLEELGAYLMWSERDPRAGEAILKQAGELGRGSAWVTLAEGAMYGYLGAKQRGKFEDFAQKARAAGAERIEVLEAERSMWGIGMRASGPKTIATLERASEQGNATALKALIALVRNGNQSNIRKEPERARAYLERFSSLLSPAEIEYFNLSIDAAKTKQLSQYAELADRYLAQDRRVTSSLAHDLYAANPNLVIYMLQTDMKRRGVYAGAINGLATGATIKALFKECETLPYSRGCADHVLDPAVIGELLAM